MKQAIHLSHHSLVSLVDLCEILRREGVWTSERSVAEEVGTLARGVFDLVVWADRQIHWSEWKLLDILAEQSAAYAQEATPYLEAPAGDDGFSERIPHALDAAIAFDRKHGTRLSNVFVNLVENLGRSILMIDGRASRSEEQALGEYLAGLRQHVGITLEPQPA